MEEWADKVGQQLRGSDSLFCVVFWNITVFSPVVKNLKKVQFDSATGGKTDEVRRINIDSSPADNL